ATAIGEVRSVRGPIAGGVATGSAQQAADTASAFQAAAEVVAASVAEVWRVVHVPLLNYPQAVINIKGRGLQDAVEVLKALAQAAQAIINEFAVPEALSAGQRCEERRAVG